MADNVLLTSLPKYNIEDSNIALLGSDASNSTLHPSLYRVLMLIDVQ